MGHDLAAGFALEGGYLVEVIQARSPSMQTYGTGKLTGRGGTV
jgi:hypothetical protein